MWIFLASPYLGLTCVLGGNSPFGLSFKTLAVVTPFSLNSRSYFVGSLVRDQHLRWLSLGPQWTSPLSPPKMVCAFSQVLDYFAGCEDSNPGDFVFDWSYGCSPNFYFLLGNFHQNLVVYNSPPRESSSVGIECNPSLDMVLWKCHIPPT